MAFKFSNLSLPVGKSRNKDLDPDTAIIDDTDTFGADEVGGSDGHGDAAATKGVAARAARERRSAPRSSKSLLDDDSDRDGQAPAVEAQPRRVGRTPILGQLPLHRQTRILLTVIGIGLVGALGTAAWEGRVARIFSLQNTVVGDAMMHSQRLAKAAGIAVQGNALAFDQLKGSLSFLTAASTALTRDGVVDGVDVPAAGGMLVEPVARFAQVLDGTVPDVNDVLGQQAALIRFNQTGSQIRTAADELIATTQRAIEAARRAGAGASELSLLAQMD